MLNQNKLLSLYQAGHFLGKEQKYENLKKQCYDQIDFIGQTERNVRSIILAGGEYERAINVGIDENAFSQKLEKIQCECDAIKADEDCESEETYFEAKQHEKAASDLYKEALKPLKNILSPYREFEEAHDYLMANQSEIERLFTGTTKLEEEIDACELSEDKFQEVYRNACRQEGKKWLENAKVWHQNDWEALSQLQKKYGPLIENAEWLTKTEFLHTPDISYKTYKSRLRDQQKAREILAAVGKLGKEFENLKDKERDMEQLTPTENCDITDGPKLLQNIQKLGYKVEGIHWGLVAHIEEFRKTYKHGNCVICIGIEEVYAIDNKEFNKAQLAGSNFEGLKKYFSGSGEDFSKQVAGDLSKRFGSQFQSHYQRVERELNDRCQKIEEDQDLSPHEKEACLQAVAQGLNDVQKMRERFTFDSHIASCYNAVKTAVAELDKAIQEGQDLETIFNCKKQLTKANIEFQESTGWDQKSPDLMNRLYEKVFKSPLQEIAPSVDDQIKKIAPRHFDDAK